MAVLIRWLIAFVLLAATWNPTDWNFSRWAVENWETQLPLAVLGALVLVVVYIVYLRATLRTTRCFFSKYSVKKFSTETGAIARAKSVTGTGFSTSFIICSPGNE